MNEVWIQLIAALGTIFGGLFLTIRYNIKENNKAKEGFLSFLRESNEQQMEYYEKKNGHLERISKDFTTAINKNTRSIDKLAAQRKR